MKKFYQNLIEVESLTLELDKLDLDEEQKIHLASLIDSSLHHTILDAILSELSDTDKRAFIHILNEDDHDKIWKFLNKRVDNIEEKIKKVVEELKEELHKDMKQARRIKRDK